MGLTSTPFPAGATQQDIQRSIANAHALADLWNANALKTYKNTKAGIIGWNGTLPPGQAPAPLPDTPYIYAVDEAAVTAGEQADNLDLSRCLIPMKYVDPDLPKAPPPQGPIVLDLAHPVVDGYYRSVAGNDKTLPENYEIEFPAGSGNKYIRQTELMFGVLWTAKPKQ